MTIFESKQIYNNYREKAMELGKELLLAGDITEKQLQNSYYELYIKNNR